MERRSPYPIGKVMISGSKLLVVLLLSASVLGGVSTWSYRKGASSVQQAWDIERASLLAAALKVDQDNRAIEQAHRLETAALEAKLKEAETRYEEALAAVSLEFGGWLRQSEDRATRYRGWAEGESGERERLADYAARLDASLAEGRGLVAEFRVALGQCQRDLKALGEQITLDRGLIGE